MTPMLHKIQKFLQDGRGNASIEIAIFAPLLIFLLGAAYVYFDAYRQRAINTNAAYTISDALSRETDAVTNGYMDGMHDMLSFLARSGDQVGLRVTMVRWNKNKNAYRRDWSKTRGPLYPLKNRDLNTTLVDNLPSLLHNERVIVVETSSIYTPPLNIPGIDSQEMYTLAFSRPRFAPQLVWSDN
ncbi:hypothetical protein Q4577_02405 [Marinovum sp. 2_MG-2023]|uniref:TadE/TadG family type IV pilus assembly protein n=1 Tax=Roseobacteraceae TaxID=2854170 RepID=UPI001FD0292E|nr:MULTISPECIES: hypothetical protein [Roseobacteraceae]MCJ7874679.1 hypothetical protein [Phaeobacter sp. J2-8]MDO6728850.1 hypothetical protein [Marinovum sp. 2_MG-2023]MDO6777734.1 hypothetical protein [Marinovum sp. 1_MG-2023]